jgi:GGDEF domain-containing protein
MAGLAGRRGREEVAALLPGSGDENALVVAERRTR